MIGVLRMLGLCPQDASSSILLYQAVTAGRPWQCQVSVGDKMTPDREPLGGRKYGF